jgi:glutathione S-transferase
MSTLTLVIGNKNYSSWSLRPWLVSVHFGIPFEEVRIPLYQSDTQARLAEWSPSGLVPVLRDGALTVWDSLSICEYLAERFPQLALWPSDHSARAVARSVSAEMHSGFSALREHMSMNIRVSRPGKGRAPGVQEDIDRVCALWRECRSRYGDDGEFLFGRFSIADAMFAPVATRFTTYHVDLDEVCGAYVRSIYALPAMQRWVSEARAEAEVIERYEY